MIQLKISYLLVFGLLLCCFGLQRDATAEPLWYTVQAGSFVSQNDAEKLYTTLASELPPPSTTDLRIENISSYFTVRVGKFDSRKEVLPLFKVLKKWSRDPAIIHAFVKKSRISKYFTSNTFPEKKSARSEEPSPQAESSHAEKQYYTVQIGTFIKEQDTEKLYLQMANKLPRTMLDFLRVEKISSFFTIRAGRTINRQTIAPIFEEVKKHSTNPAVIHGYLRNSRVIKSYTGFHSADRATEAVSTVDVHEQKKATPSPSQLTKKIIEESATHTQRTNKPVSFATKAPSSDLQTKQSEKEPLFFIIQAGSFVGKNDANRFHDFLAERLPKDMLSFLRVEKVGSFFTVRFGKSSNRSGVKPLFEEAQKLSDNPAIIHAYVREKRIIKSFSKSTFNLNIKTIIEPKESALVQPKSPSAKPTRKQLIKTDKKPTKPLAFSNELVPPAETPTKEPGSSTVIPVPVAQQTVSTEKKPRVKSNKSALIQPKQPAQQSNKQPATFDENAAEKTPTPRALPNTKPIFRSKKTTKVEIAQPKLTLTKEEYEKLLLSRYLTSDYKSKDVKKSRHQAAAFPETPDCTTTECHGLMLNIKNGHSPSMNSKCLSCHSKTNLQHPGNTSPAFELKESGAELCRQCHLTILQGEIIHSPAAEGECLECHSPHGSGNPYLLTVEKGDDQLLCKGCHDATLFEHRYTHGPVGLGACTQCHNPHASSYKSLLREEPKELCFICHYEFKKGLNESPYIHSAVAEQDCQSCHKVHGSSFPNLLTSDPNEFCFPCHREVQDKFSKARTKHAGLYLNKQCATCHKSHYSQHKYLLINSEKELCLSCHGSNSALESFSPKNIEEEIKDKEYIHSPVAEGKCTSCHDQHGSQYNSLLIDQYPSSFYAPYKAGQYGLCFSCHNQNLLSGEKTAENTKFRNGSQNLHFAHVSIERKGRTCKACHSSHASDGPKLINRTGATFGAWTMAIDFNITETGGSCMPGCHREMFYDRQEPAINNKEESSFGESFIDYNKQ